MPISRMIWVTFRREGIHCYPEAQTAPALADVNFLGSKHRHIFHFRVAVSVEHLNRDIEFIQFLHWCEGRYSTKALELSFKSCEMIAEELGTAIRKEYPGRERVVVEVSEDGENGCVLEWDNPKPKWTRESVDRKKH